MQGFVVRIEGPTECLAVIEDALTSIDTTSREIKAKSISSFGIDAALLVDLAKTSVPVLSAAIGGAVTLGLRRSVKVNGIEIRGYSAADIEKLLGKLHKLDKPMD